MPRVDFYHLQNKPLEEVLPKLLEKAYETGKNIKIKIGNPERVETINSHLWTYDDEAFLPHGSAKDGNTKMQPIFLTFDDENPNDAEFLFLIDGAKENINGFERVFNIFDGDDAEALNKAREFWKELKSGDADLHYWQLINGKWTEKV